MLKSYLSCKYIIFNEVNEKKLNLKKIELTKNDQLRLEKGNIHEKNYLKELKKKYKKVIDIKNSDLSKEEKHVQRDENAQHSRGQGQKGHHVFTDVFSDSPRCNN